MNWTVGFILAIGILLPIGLGLGLGAYRAAQNPLVLAEAAALALKSLLPLLKELAKRNDPETEKRMQEVIRRAGEWDNFRKRERGR